MREASPSDDRVLESLVTRLASAPIPRGADVAIGVVDERTLVGLPLDGRPKWLFSHPLEDRPVVAGQVVVGSGAGELFALDAGTGSLLWKRPAVGELRGAGDDGQTTLVSMRSATGHASILLAVSHKGNVVRQIEDTALVGVPTMVQGYAFVPWEQRSHFLSVYDVLYGKELARLSLPSRVSRAFTVGGALFFGESEATRFDARVELASLGHGSTSRLPLVELPGSPTWLRSGFSVASLDALPSDTARIYARPTPTGRPGFEGSALLATYDSLVMGLDAGSGRLRWVRGQDAEYIAGDAHSGGFVLCDRAGKLSMVDAESGQTVRLGELGSGLRSCVVHLDGFDERPEAGPVRSLARQIGDVLAREEPRLVLAQRFLLGELAKLDDEGVAPLLVAVASRPGAQRSLVAEARRLIADRRRDAAYLLAALGQAPRGAGGVVPEFPIGPIAEALAAMNERRAAPTLARLLSEGDALPEDALSVARALERLASKEQADALSRFLLTNRREDSQARVLEAISVVAQTLIGLGRADLVSAIAGDPLAHAEVRDRCAAAMTATAPARE